jgi:chromosome segregation ATPase
MASRLLRHIAVTIGAGLATGFSIGSVARKTRRSTPANFAPVLTRIEDIETRVARVELAPAPVIPSPEEIAALSTLVSSQTEDIASLRQAIEKIEARNAAQAEAFAQKLALVEQQVPAHIEAAVNSRIAELEHKLRGEFEQIHHRTVDAFTESIEKRVVGRIAALENSLVEQSQSIAGLREKSLKTDDNLQRLLEAVEKLCARAEAQAQIMTPRPAPPPPPTLASEHEMEFAGAPRHESRSSGLSMKAAGMAIVGLAFLGFRLFR